MQSGAVRHKGVKIIHGRDGADAHNIYKRLPPYHKQIRQGVARRRRVYLYILIGLVGRKRA